jgi:hypothetical protein
MGIILVVLIYDICSRSLDMIGDLVPFRSQTVWSEVPDTWSCFRANLHWDRTDGLIAIA